MKKIFLLSLLFALTGCTPGEAEFTMKTSEVLKALRGGSARIRVHEKLAIPLSNACERVAFGGGRFTNQLDVVKALVAKQKRLFPLHEFFDEDKERVAELTNDTVRLTVDEPAGKVPVLRMEADFAVWLSQTNVLDRAIRDRTVCELSALSIDGGTGTIRDSEFVFKCQLAGNPRFMACMAMIGGQCELMDVLFGEMACPGETMKTSWVAVIQAWQSVFYPTWFRDLSCVIVGDSDEPLSVEAEDVVIDGRHHDTFKAVVKRGETLRMKINKNRDHGGVRFGSATE